MSKPVTSGWPEAGAFPFMPFPLPGTAAAQAPPMPGLTGGMDLIKDFWSRLPGGAALPGFMVPTVDVDELDKRIAELKAAERWVEINLGMLRTTIQGLEVQRHTIAAIQALTTPAAAPSTAASTAASTAPSTAASTAPSTAPSTPAPEPSSADAPGSNDWLAYLQAQFTRVAEAAMTPPAAPPPAAETAGRRKVAKKTAPRKTSKPR